MKARKWTVEQLRTSAKGVYSIRQLLGKLGLREAGGNYKQVKQYILEYKIDTSHFRGMGWNKGQKGRSSPRIGLSKILVQDSTFQSHKLKKRLFVAGLKERKCEMCGWNRVSADGRVPLELDHINGNSRDNRIENLRILCPNCHSLQPTHRGRNMQHMA